MADHDADDTTLYTAQNLVEMFQELEGAGLLVAFRDLCKVVERWHDGTRVKSPHVALLAIELFALVFAEQGNIPPERQQKARNAATLLTPYLKVVIAAQRSVEASEGNRPKGNRPKGNRPKGEPPS